MTGRLPDHPAGGDDDLPTAELIERARVGQPLDATTTAQAVAHSEEAGRTLAVRHGHVHPDDITYVTVVDRFDFAMEAERLEGRIRLTHHCPS